MMKFGSISPGLGAEVQSSAPLVTRSEIPTRRRAQLLVAFVVLALAALCAPWMSGKGASLSLTAYDLAEWSSLVPGVRYGEQPMVTPGLLRAQLLILASLVALLPLKRGTVWWWMCGIGAVTLVFAQLPPFEYFLEASWRSDVNYGQQVTLALLSLINAGVCWSMPRGWTRRLTLVSLAGLGIVSALAGASRALALAAQFDVAAGLGVGVMGYVVAMAGIVIAVTMPARRKT